MQIADYEDVILLGNCLEILPKLPAECTALIILDYPYGITPLSWDKPPDSIALITECVRIMKPNSTLVMTGKQPQLRAFTKEWDAYLTFCHGEVWLKQNSAWSANSRPLTTHEDVWWWSKGKSPWDGRRLGEPSKPYIVKRTRIRKGISKLGDHVGVKTRSYPESAYFYDRVQGGHPTQKPIKLYLRFILATTKKGDLVVDPFMGSGTTAAIALLTKRHFFGCDISEKWVGFAEQRISKLRGHLECK